MSNQESSKFEESLIGKRVQIRSSDWQRTISGALVKVERYTYVLRLDKGGVLCVLMVHGQAQVLVHLPMQQH